MTCGYFTHIPVQPTVPGMDNVHKVTVNAIQEITALIVPILHVPAQCVGMTLTSHSIVHIAAMTIVSMDGRFHATS
jgi:hypothetical protein